MDRAWTCADEESAGMLGYGIIDQRQATRKAVCHGNRFVEQIRGDDRGGFMSVDVDQLVRVIRQLPDDKISEVLDFARFLAWQ